MKNMIRAVRRFHRKRMIRHARSIFAGNPRAELYQGWAEKMHDHLCRCTCHYCHNKRKKFGPTIQERRNLQVDPIDEYEQRDVERLDAPDSSAADGP